MIRRPLGLHLPLLPKTAASMLRLRSHWHPAVIGMPRVGAVKEK